MSKTDIVVFQSKDGLAQLEVKTDYDTVWLSKAQLADLFERDRSVISRHINNIFKEDELQRESNVQKMHIPNSDRPVEFFSLDVIISVGYRVKSKRGVEFRQWATKVLKDFMIQGFAINESRVKNAPSSLLDLFKIQVEMWERQELMNHEIKNDIKGIAEKIQAIESKIKSVDDGYYTVAGYCALIQKKCPIHLAQKWGKLAVKLSRESNTPTGAAHDERFGKVRTYHIDILKQVIK